MTGETLAARAPGVAPHPVPPVLTVVIPCYNERANVAPMVARLSRVLDGLDWEAVFVDDNSPDGTAAAVRAIARGERRVRCIRRIGRRGLSSAVIEGALSSSADFVAVIDGDLQHDETRLPLMLAALREGHDLAVGSRHVPGGDAEGLSGAWRHRLSNLGIRAAQAMLPVPLSDPMSGFFMLPRPLFEEIAPRLTSQGFKVLLDIVLSSPRPLRVKEVPMRFQPRVAGESKLDVLILMQFGALLLDKALHGLVPLRFISFGLVGLVGVGVHLSALEAAGAAGLEFGAAQVVATLTAMLANFWLNNSVTYRQDRLRGARFWRGLVLFVLVCGLGAVANVGIAKVIYDSGGGWTFPALLGAMIGMVWNYAISATLVWGRR